MEIRSRMAIDGKIEPSVWRFGRLNWLQQNWLRGEPDDPESAHANTLVNRLPLTRVRIRDLLDVLAAVVARHESLRTVVTYDQAGVGMQSVQEAPHSPADIEHVVELLPIDVSRRLAELRQAPALDIRREWPVRFVVGHDGGYAHEVYILIDHSAADEWGLQVLSRDILWGLDVGVHPLLDTGLAVTQPLDMTQWEDSPSGIKRGRRAVQYWRETFQEISDYISLSGRAQSSPPVGKCRRHELHSTQLHSAAVKAATRFKVSKESVFLCAFGWALSLMHDSEVMGVVGLHCNRFFEPELRSVSLRYTGAPVAISAPRTNSAETLVRRTHAQRLKSMSVGYAPPHGLDEVIEEVLPEASSTAVCGALFNYTEHDSLLESSKADAPSCSVGENDRIVVGDDEILRGPSLMLRVRSSGDASEVQLQSRADSGVFAQEERLLKLISGSVYWMASGADWSAFPRSV
ncbi:condensation domain-containing protein [Streptomyces sp. NPDC001137]|uniref:condensation domain-containing protein n=1 Tax=Streptomyces sp. NPDC001137 TaxID=3154378 RepID=UPI00332AC5E9